MTRWRIALLLVLLAATTQAAEPPRQFTPHAGFEGESHGTGTLVMLGGRPRPFTVRSHGALQPDGSLHLVQTIDMQGEPVRERSWTIRTVAPGRYEATLTDAAGRVTGRHVGPRLSLHYRITGPLVMRQELVLADDGRTIDNVGTITIAGIPVGRLRETIVRVDGAAPDTL